MSLMKANLSKIQPDDYDSSASEIVMCQNCNGDLVQCCNVHFLLKHNEAIGNVGSDLLTRLENQNLKNVIEEKENVITSLSNDIIFLKNQIQVLNNLLDQLSIINVSKNDIKIKVESYSPSEYRRKWWKNAKAALYGGAVLVILGVYLRFKLKK